MKKNSKSVNLIFLDEKSEIINSAIDFVSEFFKNDSSGHDFSHTMRVYKLAKHILEIELRTKLINSGVVLLSALLHDVDDYKLSSKTQEKKENARKFLKKNNVSDEDISKIVTAISEVSFFGKDSVVPSTIEGKIVQDSDRLDAIGAIGIARTFAYGGKHGRPLYDPDIKPNLNMDKETYKNSKEPTINHFYEKLLLLENMMNTDTAKKIAKERTAFMQSYLDEFFDEWDGKK